MLSHQLPQLKPFEVFWNQLPNFFNWFYEDYHQASLVQLQPFLGEDKDWTCLVLICEKDTTLSYPERYFIPVPGKEIIRLNQSGKVWCQPLNLIDVTRKGDSKFVHDKLYEVILMYLNKKTKTFISYNSLKHNKEKTSLESVRAGDVFDVPGYFFE